MSFMLWRDLSRRFLAGIAWCSMLFGPGAWAQTDNGGGPSSTVVNLGPVTVTAAPPTGYTAPDASSATKTDTPIMETPVSVQVIPQQVLQDQQVVHLDDALQNVAGVIPNNDGYGTSDSFTIRGFDQNELTFEDGVKLDQYTVSGFPLDTANIERVEVVKGPASVLYGQAEPGGLVNVVTKKPQESAAYAANEQIGSYGFYRTTLDATGPIDTGKSILYRFILDDENAGSFRDFVYTHRLSLFPSLTWKLSNTDRVTAEFKYSTGTEVSDNGIPFLPDGTPSNVPISRNYAEPGANAGPIDQYAIKITGLHAFSEAWKLRVVYKSEYIDNPVPNFHIYAGDADASGNLQRFGFATNIFNHWTHQGVADLTGTFDLFGMKHTALVGADFYHLDGNYDANFFSLPSINIYRPVYGQPYSLPPSSTDFFVGELENAFGAYAQDQVDLPGHVHLLAGFRYDNVVASDSGYGNAASKVHDHPSPKPRFGILWQAAPQLSVYASYTENYGATALGGLTLNGTVLPPESAQQYEFGVKTEWLQQRLSATASVYQLTKENVPTADPANPAFTIAVGRARSRGAEFEVAGKITAGWQIIAGYSYIDSITTQDHNTPSLAGLRFPGVPYNSGSLWTTYELRTGKLRGLKLGLGTVARGSEVAFESPTGTGYLADRIPSFAVINAMAAYTLQFGRAKVDAQINVNNLLDKAYYSAVNPSQATPGAPLSAMGLLRIHL